MKKGKNYGNKNRRGWKMKRDWRMKRFARYHSHLHLFTSILSQPHHPFVCCIWLSQDNNEVVRLNDNSYVKHIVHEHIHSMSHILFFRQLWSFVQRWSKLPVTSAMWLKRQVPVIFPHTSFTHWWNNNLFSHLMNNSHRTIPRMKRRAKW